MRFCTNFHVAESLEGEHGAYIVYVHVKYSFWMYRVHDIGDHTHAWWLVCGEGLCTAMFHNNMFD